MTEKTKNVLNDMDTDKNYDFNNTVQFKKM